MSTTHNLDHSGKPSNSRNESPRSPSILKLRKIPHIAVRQRHETDDDDDDHENDESTSEDKDSPIMEASTLGLNHIRTRSAPLPLKSSNSIGTPSSLGHHSQNKNNNSDTGGLNSEVNPRQKISPVSQQSASTSTKPEQGQFFFFLVNDIHTHQFQLL